MIRLLGRQTSGNVQKVLFCLEEIGLKYTREDYGLQFNNTNTDAYRKLNPNIKVPTLVDGDVVIWNMDPLSTYSRAEKVYIDGDLFFDSSLPGYGTTHFSGVMHGSGFGAGEDDDYEGGN